MGCCCVGARESLRACMYLGLTEVQDEANIAEFSAGPISTVLAASQGIKKRRAANMTPTNERMQSDGLSDKLLSTQSARATNYCTCYRTLATT